MFPSRICDQSEVRAVGESGFFSGVSVVIPVRSDEDPAWLTDLISTARLECNEILLIVESDADVTEVRPALGSFGEKVRFVYQTGDGKADALNAGLLSAKNVHVVFLDADVLLEPGQLTMVRALLQDPEDPVEFVSVPYGMRPPPFVPIGFVSGWFFGCKRSVFLSIGGWAEGFVEDVETSKRITRSGHKIRVAPFSVKLRRPVQRPVTKLFSVLTSFGRR